MRLIMGKTSLSSFQPVLLQHTNKFHYCFNQSALMLYAGDMSWRIVSEPWEYGYAQHLNEEMPFKDKEQEMIEEVSLFIKKCVAIVSYIIRYIVISQPISRFPLYTGERRVEAPLRAFHRSLPRMSLGDRPAGQSDAAQGAAAPPAPLGPCTGERLHAASRDPPPGLHRRETRPRRWHLVQHPAQQRGECAEPAVCRRRVLFARLSLDVAARKQGLFVQQRYRRWGW